MRLTNRWLRLKVFTIIGTIVLVAGFASIYACGKKDQTPVENPTEPIPEPTPDPIPNPTPTPTPNPTPTPAPNPPKDCGTGLYSEDLSGCCVIPPATMGALQAVNDDGTCVS